MRRGAEEGEKEREGKGEGNRNRERLREIGRVKEIVWIGDNK